MAITKKLGRKSENRDRLARNLATSLVLHERITTTQAKAKAIVPVVERLLTVSRRGDLSARRYAASMLYDKNAVTKLFEDLPKRLGTRTSGFLRITKLQPRPGDGAAMAVVEILAEAEAPEPKKKGKASKAEAAEETEVKEESTK